MATRDLTHKYNAMHNNKIHRIDITQDNEYKRIDDDTSTVPEWIFLVQEIKEHLECIKKDITIISKLQREQLNIGFGVEYELIYSTREKEIETLVSQATKNLRACEYKIKLMLSTNSRADITSRINVARYLGAEMSKASNELRQTQREFLKKLRKQNSMSSVCFGDVNENEVDVTLQQQMDQHDVAYKSKTRHAAILKVAKDIEELNNLSRELNALVIDQDDKCNNIAYNLENASQNVIKANKELTKLEKQTRSSWGCKVFVFMLLLNVLLLIILIAKKA